MKIYASVPECLVEGWVATTERHDPREKVPSHYHDVEEWLQVQRGEICFFSAGGRAHALGVGQALQIPRGEVHRVEIGPDGVEYRMWVPVAVPGSFANLLDDEDLALIQRNLGVAKAEDLGDESFFDAFFAKELTFRPVSGPVLDRKGFRDRGFKNRNRLPSDWVRVLHRGADSVLLLTAVVVPGDGGATQCFSNERLFVREGTSLRCRVWLNYPDLQGQLA